MRITKKMKSLYIELEIATELVDRLEYKLEEMLWKSVWGLTNEEEEKLKW